MPDAPPTLSAMLTWADSVPVWWLLLPVVLAAGTLTFFVQRVNVRLRESARLSKAAEQREKFRSHVLELLAHEQPLPTVLDAIVRGVEQSNPGMLCTILLLDESTQTFRAGAAPSVPEFYSRAIETVTIGPGVGSCGTAAYTGQRVVVEDIQTHPYWTPFRDLARQADLRACWSEPIRSGAGQVLGTFAIYHRVPQSPGAEDIQLIEQSAQLAAIAIERARSQEALRLSEARHRLLADNASDVIWTMDLDGRFTYVSPSVERLRGYTPAEVVGQPLEQSLTPESARAAREGLQRIVQALNSGKPVGQIPPMELEHPSKHGGSVWTEATISVMHDGDGQFVGVLGVTRDISERRQAQQRMAYLAQHDPLTGLPNRTLLDDRIRQALGRARREGTQVALMFLDLDHFKPINDLHGHAVGDVVLQQAARRISDCLRATDTVARIGGDEFVVLLTVVDQGSAAMAVAEKIREALAQPFEIQGLFHEVSCSIGIALYPEHGPGALDLSRHADAAMYQAKARGRNQVMLYERPLATGTDQVPRT